MKLKSRTLTCALASWLCACIILPSWLAGESKPGKDLRTIRVLFIGNSYTYFNDLPAIFAKLAEAGHQATVETTMIAPGGTRLQDHLEKGDDLKVLQSSKWDYVVLQDQSVMGTSYYVNGTPRVVTDKYFTPYAEKWVTEIRKSGATPVFYLTWARKAAPEDQAELNYAYIHVAKETHSVVAPAGIAWSLVRKSQPNIDLFYKDGSHPSPAGSYLSACAMYASIFHRDPAGLPSQINGIPVNLETEKLETDKLAMLVDLPQDQAKVLQSAAWKAWKELQKHGGYVDVSPAPPPTLLPLPSGQPLTPETLAGTWTGTTDFYPSGTADMILQLGNDGSAWKAHLELKFHYPDFKDESIDVTDLKVGEEMFSFRDPKSWSGTIGDSETSFDVHFTAVRTAPDELQGTAETSRPEAEGLLHWLGTWHLRRQPRGAQ
ncbi:MAG TPA: SGNH/GDSL hydrolase family protein [Candidatus Sulfotelmatobacter sp.]|nr:SGNH/GDSL hydrolase family protein [Candidatus Sulfotelmatobacter sp.]